jgi:glycosyltransferase involved in cell wall biosynthesis
VISSGGAAAPSPRRVCFFGTYNREHTVTRLLAQACRAAGIEVVECHRPLWEQTRDKLATYFGARSLLRLLCAYVRQAFVLHRARRALGAVPLYIVGFNGQLDCLLLRWLLRRQPTPIVFAPLVTLTETLVDDRGVFASHSAPARLARAVDRASLAAATRVVIDAEAHRQYLLQQFGLPPERVSTWHLGADASVFKPAPPPDDGGGVRVLFYGTFLPLHGVRTILAAAARLRDQSRIDFVLVGDGPEHAASVAFVQDAGLRQVAFRDWVAYGMLGDTIASADICLGVFGVTPKAQMVIPNKVFQAATVGRPVITADTPAVREVFVHGETAWLCPPGDAEALAHGIAALSADATLRHRLGSQAAALMAERFSVAAQGQRLAEILSLAAGRG